MDTAQPTWLHFPAARQAAAAGQYGTLLRLARAAAALTLAEAGRLAGYSPATLSRMETGRRPLTDITVLRHLAGVFDIPLGMFGLAELPGASAPRHGVRAGNLPRGQTQEGGDDPVRRRELLTGLAGLTATAALPKTPPNRTAIPDQSSARGADPAAGIIDVLLHDGRAAPPDITLDAVRADLRAAKVDFQTCRYQALTGRLPRLLTAAHALDDTTSSEAHSVRAEIYNTAAHVLIKLGVAGPSWVAADRALAAAKASGDPVIAANVTRNVVTLCRGEHRYSTAQQLALEAASELDLTGTHPYAAHVSLYGMLLCNAGYAAAQAGDRHRATELLDHASATAKLLGADRNDHWTAFGPTNVTLHRLSAALSLGDTSTAIQQARTINPARIQVVERRARYWVDVASAYQQWGKPAACLKALKIAERLAPEEVRYRPIVKTVTTSLLATPTGIQGLRDFATRVGVPT